MDIRVLKYFLMVAREENITHAAELLHVTQPTLSRQLQQLEQDLGTKLFARSNHSIYLTSEGALFRRRAQEIVALSEIAREELQHENEEVSGRIAMGLGELQGVKEIGRLMAAFQKEYPKVKFDVYSSDNEDIKDRIERGVLEIGLLLEPVSISQYDFIRMKTREKWGILVHKNNPLAGQPVIRPGDMVGQRVVTVHFDTPVHNELRAWSGDYARDMANAVNYNTLYNAAIIAREREGLVICLKLDSHFKDMKFIPLAPKLELRSVLAWRRQEIHPKATAAFIDFLKKELV